MRPPFCYLPETKRWVNLATIVEAQELWDRIQVRTLAPDGQQPYDGGGYSPDHYTLHIKLGTDAAVFARAIDQLCFLDADSAEVGQ